jgi:hypothetical protein
LRGGSFHFAARIVVVASLLRLAALIAASRSSGVHPVFGVVSCPSPVFASCAASGCAVVAYSFPGAVSPVPASRPCTGEFSASLWISGACPISCPVVASLRASGGIHPSPSRSIMGEVQEDFAAKLGVLALFRQLDGVPQFRPVAHPVRHVLGGKDFGMQDAALAGVIADEAGAVVVDPAGGAVGRRARGAAPRASPDHLRRKAVRNHARNPRNPRPPPLPLLFLADVALATYNRALRDFRACLVMGARNVQGSRERRYEVG